MATAQFWAIHVISGRPIDLGSHHGPFDTPQQALAEVVQLNAGPLNVARDEHYVLRVDRRYAVRAGTRVDAP